MAMTSIRPLVSPSRVRRLRVRADILLSMLMAKDVPRYYEIVESPIPADAEVQSVSVSPDGVVEIYMVSASFDVVQEGHSVPNHPAPSMAEYTMPRSEGG